MTVPSPTTYAKDNSTLIIFCRRPAPGIGKQRIAAELGQRAAYEIGELLLAAALEDTRNWPGLIVLSPASAADAPWATGLLENARVIPQPEGNLGQRIEAVHQQVRNSGSEKIIIIGSDAPTLSPTCLAAAAASLTSFDTVIVPARDGGITLLGTRLVWPALAALPWETPQLGEELIRCCQNAGHRLHIMATGSDIDTRQDLLDTYVALKTDRRPARIKLCNWIERSGLITIPRQSGKDISVIIPVFNDVDTLQRLLESLTAMRPGISEIIVADGSARSDCKRLCSDYGAIYLPTEANRGKQLCEGAAIASQDILWFLHADSNPPADAVNIIRQHLQQSSGSGYFRFRFDGPRRWYKHLLELAINFRARVGIPYGDQGLFASRQAYFAAGGHAATPLFEEVVLVRNLRAATGCRPVAATIGVSPRRWERDGWLQRSLHNRALALGYALGVAPERLARHYAATSHRNRAKDDRNG